MSAGCIKHFLSLSSLSYQDSVQSVNGLTALVSVCMCVSVEKPKLFIHPNIKKHNYLCGVFSGMTSAYTRTNPVEHLVRHLSIHSANPSILPFHPFYQFILIHTSYHSKNLSNPSILPIHFTSSSNPSILPIHLFYQSIHPSFQSIHPNNPSIHPFYQFFQLGLGR